MSSATSPASGGAVRNLFDTVIIGGGPAGLTCGIFLARARRSVAIVDGGEPRNAATRAIHGFLGLDGTTPAELRQRGRAEAVRAGATFFDGNVIRVERRDGRLEAATSDHQFRARTLVLAYGLRDKLPVIPGFDAFYGSSIFHCPDCDAGDFADQSIGVVGWQTKAAAMALLLKNWSNRICLCTNGNDPELGADAEAKLHGQEIRVHRQPIARLHGREGRLDEVELVSGETLGIRVLFFATGAEQACGLAGALGCEMDEVRPHVRVDHQRRTSVPGVYAIGDLVAGSQLAITAAADGAVAALAINKDLLPREWTMD